MDDEGQFESEGEEIKACHELLDKHRVEDIHIVNGEDLSLYGRIALLTGDLDFGNGNRKIITLDLTGFWIKEET